MAIFKDFRLQNLIAWLNRDELYSGAYGLEPDILHRYSRHATVLEQFGLRSFSFEDSSLPPPPHSPVFLTSVMPQENQHGLLIGEFGGLRRRQIYLQREVDGLLVIDKVFPEDTVYFCDNLISYYIQVSIFRLFYKNRKKLSHTQFYQYLSAFLSTFSGVNTNYDNVMLDIFEHHLVNFHWGDENGN